MRFVLWIALFVLALTAVVIPLVYLYTARRLPRLGSELDLERRLRASIESERMSVQLGAFAESAGGVRFERPSLDRYPKDLVALYLSQRGCPGYLQTPREEGAGWGLRMIAGLLGTELSGDGFCEKVFAWRMAERIGARGALQLTVGAHKVHGILGKEQLIAYELAAMRFERAVVGVEAASFVLFKKPLSDLQLSELGELAVALPPHNYYDHVKNCRSPSIVRQNRDYLLQAAAQRGLIGADQVKLARLQPLACGSR